MELPKPQQLIKPISFFNLIKISECKAQRMISWDDELYNEFLKSIFNNIPTGQIILNYISSKNIIDFFKKKQIIIPKKFSTNKKNLIDPRKWN